MKLKTGLLILLLIAVAAYSGAHYYLQTQIKEKMEQLERLVYPHVEFTYGKISSDLRGIIQVDNINLKSSEGASLQIERVELEGPGPRFLWDLINNFESGQPPESLILKLNKVWFPVGQNIIKGFQSALAGEVGVGDGQAHSCTLQGMLSHSGLEQLGIDSLVANSVVGYRLSQSDGVARVFLEYEIQGLESISFALSLDGIPKPGAVFAGAIPSFTSLDLYYSLQPSYIKRMLNHCAQLADASNEQFLDSIFEQSDTRIAANSGFVPGVGIKQMLRKLISQGGTVQLSANPATDLDMAKLSAYKPEDILRLLKVKVALDDQPVTDLSFDLIGSGFDSATLAYGENRIDRGDLETGAGNDDTESRNGRLRMRYLETSVSELHNYIGSRVRLYTRNSGIPKEGLLALLKGDVFSVEQSIHGGKMTAHVRFSDISKAEVLRLAP